MISGILAIPPWVYDLAQAQGRDAEETWARLNYEPSAEDWKEVYAENLKAWTTLPPPKR